MSLLVVVLGTLSSSLRKSLDESLSQGFVMQEVSFVDASNRPQWLKWDSNSSSHGFGVGKGAAGCWLAHRDAWVSANSLDFECILILEDDAQLTRYGLRYLKQTVDYFYESQIQMLHLGDHEKAIFLKPISMLLSGNIRRIFRDFLERVLFHTSKPKIAQNRFPFSAHGYLVKKSFLPNLIDNSPVFIFPVDVFLNSISQVRRNQVAAVRTPLIIQAASRESLIDKFGR